MMSIMEMSMMLCFEGFTSAKVAIPRHVAKGTAVFLQDKLG